MTGAIGRVLAQSGGSEEAVPFWDNAVLDHWEIPFGAWMDEIVNWIVLNASAPLDVIKWPFSFLFRNFVDGPEYHPWWEITDMSWVLVCSIVLVVGIITRNLKVGAGLAVMLALCGLLGNEFWVETTTTIGLVVVAVILCALIGIPLGVLCGRFDAVWGVVRPVLDAMQVVHAFVYIIPFIFFFGLGPEPATMTTMVFAIPPLIRLTNLGIRQVPADVVEASRAYGASEFRVLLDTQLPLARPAIMTGLNQTLLLSISMIGIAAIMGASGLGLLVFRAVLNIDTQLSTASGLALFVVAVVLDRLTQTESGQGTRLFGRIRRAWAHRRNPEALLDDSPGEEAVVDTTKEGNPAPVTKRERLGATIAAVASVAGLAAVFLPWGNDSGRISGHGRALDLDLSGLSFSGLVAEGGSFLGITVLVGSLMLLGSALWILIRPERASTAYGADGAILAASAILAAAIGYVWIPSPGEAVSYSHGLGVWIALASGVAATVGATLWLSGAPYSPMRPLRSTISVTRVLTTAGLVGLLAIAGLSSWSIDRRVEAVITPELQAEIDRLEQEARQDPSKASQNAIQIAGLSSEAQRKNPIRYDGFTASGTRLGYLTLGLGVAALLLTLPAVGLFGRGERRRWRWSVGVAALGVGILVLAGGWIASLVRVADPNFASGPGAFICLIAGFLFSASSWGILREFRRTTVYEKT